MPNRSGFRRFLMAGTAALALSAVTVLSEVAQADVTFNGGLSAWGTNADGTGGNAFNNLGGGIWGTDAVPNGTTRYFGGLTFPQAGVYNFAFGNAGLQTAPSSPASFNLADTGLGADLRAGDNTKLVFDVTNGQALQYAAAMGRVSNMTITDLGGGTSRITMLGKVIDPVASASDPTGNTIGAGYALVLLMDKNGAGTLPSGIPDQQKSIFSTNMYFSDVSTPDLAGVTGVGLNANGVNGVAGSFTALIPQSLITASGLTPLSIAGALDKAVPGGFSLAQDGVVTINGQTYFSFTASNSVWSPHDLQFGQTTGTSLIDTVISNQGTNTTLVKSGTGTLILTGANTYTGGTTVSGGTLSLGNNSAAGTGTITTTGSVIDYVNGVSIANAINVNSNTTQLQVTTGSATQAGVISETAGPRPIEKIGNGTLVLTGSNTYTGVTTITAGTLQIGNGGTVGSIAGNIANNSALTFSRSDSLTFAGVISGAGSLTQAGTGTTILTGANTYTGVTTITAGTLQIGNGGTTGSIAGNIANNGALIFNRSNNITFANVISGTASLTLAGTGTTILTAANTYTGGTIISAGTLQIGNGGTTGSISGNVANNGALIFNRSDNLTLAGVISGTGSLTQAGTGTTTLTGANTYTGATTVSAGTLSVNGSITSAVTVANGGSLKGTGTVGGLSFASGSNIAPGNSIGTLNVAGGVSLGAGSTYQVEVNGVGASDRIAATGVATLSGGTVLVQPEAGTYLPVTTYRILDAAGGVSGTFSGVTSSSAGFFPAIVYSAKAVDLRLVSSAVKFEAFGNTANQMAAGGGVTSGGVSSAMFVRLATLVADATPIQPALDALSGEIHATLLASQFEGALIARRTVLDHMRADNAVLGEGWSFWGQVAGDWGSADGNGNAAGSTRSGVDVTLGADTRLSDNWRGGIEGGYSSNQLNVTARASDADVRSGHIGAYAYGRYDAYALRAGASYGFGTARTQRSVNFTGFSDSVSASQDASSFQLFGEAGYDIVLERITIQPFVGLAWTQLNAGAFRETGGGAAVSGTAREMDNGYFTAGTQLFTESFDFSGGSLKPLLRAGWQHSFTNTAASRSLSFIATGQSFTVMGTPLDEDRALLDIGATLGLGNSQLSLVYSGALGSRTRDHAVKLLGAVNL